ncbi:hypothetical protein HYU14_01735 [Candidatus Woesearchaeota archaeon]|nr:hypothetical protein [Candidatus Woesearchaeota archaeon]
MALRLNEAAYERLLGVAYETLFEAYHQIREPAFQLTPPQVLTFVRTIPLGTLEKMATQAELEKSSPESIYQDGFPPAFFSANLRAVIEYGGLEMLGHYLRLHQKGPLEQFSNLFHSARHENLKPEVEALRQISNLRIGA